MTAIYSIMIQDIDMQYTAEYIASAFWKKEIAKISLITLIPQINNQVISNMAYITIDTYCETEAAHSFIEQLNHHGRYRFEDEPWIVQENTHNAGSLFAGPYTTMFMEDFFNQSEDQKEDQEETEYICDEEEWEEFRLRRPIKGLTNDYYTEEEALEYLALLKEQEQVGLEQEIAHFETELRIHQSLLRSNHVTARDLPRRDSRREVAMSVKEYMASL